MTSTACRSLDQRVLGVDCVHYPNISYDHDTADAVTAIAERARWTWTVPAGEVWRILWALVKNTDSIAHSFFARLSFGGMTYDLDELTALAALDEGFLMLKTPGNLAGYDRRPGELWVPSGVAFVVRQGEVNADATTQTVTLGFARADNVRGEKVSEAVVVLT